MEGKYSSHFKNIKLILHNFNQTNKIIIGNSSVDLKNENYTFLNAAGSDPQGSIYQQESNTVKVATIGNNAGIITINY